jgi:hypothetical protein
LLQWLLGDRKLFEGDLTFPPRFAKRERPAMRGHGDLISLPLRELDKKSSR